MIIERNFRCRLGEADIIAKKDGYLIFCEVKYRATDSMGMPQEAVDRKKRRRICNVASYYIYSRHIPQDTAVRFDVAAVSDDSVQMIENAFEYSGSFKA